MVISDEVAALIEGGTAAWMATGDRERRPTAARVMGARLSPDRQRLAVFITIDQAGRTLVNVAVGAPVAVFFCKVTNYRAVQIKGRVIAHGPADVDDRAIQARYMAAHTDECIAIGMSRALITGLAYWPSLRIDIEPTALFEQTPGPRAGASL